MFDEIINYTNKGIYPFHMPGHKRNTDFLSFGADPVSIDLTEVYGTDNLQNPEGIIKDMEEKASELFGADRTYAIVNGATGGILAAVLSCAKKNDTVLFARNCHMSAYSGLALCDYNIKYLYPQISAFGFPGPIALSSVEKAFGCDPNIRVVFITSPTYEGFVSDIAAIAEIAHSHGALLIVDEAHGAHFNFSSIFPTPAIKSGADIVIQSLHKTLPALTQCALLHTNGSRVNHELLRAALNMVNSSSPSYVLMSSIDKCLDFLENSAGVFETYALLLTDL
ncbi:MAG: aminotransferase class V-fold PLP-dependent enzyme, partial [Clostridiales bacterium]|nr:aminotransferase class V-fold PLP-dependent enzyme [Clostridiales bacterium]